MIIWVKGWYDSKIIIIYKQNKNSLVRKVYKDICCRAIVVI